MRKIAILITLTMLLASLAGCAGDDDDRASPVGEWWTAETMAVDFNEDGTLIDGEGNSGTWSTDGDSLTLSIDNGNDEEVAFIYAVEGDWLWLMPVDDDDCNVLSSESISPISEDEWDDRVSEQTPPSFCE